jgi:hypothetical protein
MFARHQDKMKNMETTKTNNPSVELLRGGDLEEDKMDMNAIPDIDLLSSKVVEFLEFNEQPEIIKLKKENHPHYLFKLYEKFDILPASMIKLLSEPNLKLRTQNVEKIIMLLEKLAEVKAGKRNLETTRDEFLEENNEKYFYPAFGGKEELIKLAEQKGENISKYINK